MSDGSASAGTVSSRRAAPERDSVAVIGAGFSGLLACRELRARAIPYVCFEREPELGGVWRGHPGVVSVTCRDAMELESFPMPPDMPDFPRGEQLLRLMNTYAEEFSLRERIQTDAPVASLAPEPDGGWRVTLEDGRSSLHRAVIVATGRIGDPVWPELEGDFDGRMMHAAFTT